MMKKTTRILPLVFSVLLLLVFVTASPRARSNPNPTPPVQYQYDDGGQIRWKKEMGVIPIGPGRNQASTSACSAFFIFVVDPVDNKVLGYSSLPTSQPTEQEGYYVCDYRMKVKSVGRAVLALPGMGRGDLLPEMSRQSYYWTDQWIGGTNSRPPAGWRRGLNRSHNANISSVFDQFEMIYVRGDNPNPTLDSSSEKGPSPLLRRAQNFAGAWQGKWGEGGLLELILQQTGKQVAGRLRVNSAELGLIKEGIVDGNTLRFKLFRPNINPMAGKRDEYLGVGELVMDADGKSFTGTLLGTVTNGTLVGR
jgi:hypothetical protein